MKGPVRLMCMLSRLHVYSRTKSGTILLFPSFLSVVVVLNSCQRSGGWGGDRRRGAKAACPCWCAALWCNFLCLWVKRGGSRPEGRRPRTVGFPWQLEDIQLLRILLLNSIQIFGIQVRFFPLPTPPHLSSPFSLRTAAVSSLNGQGACAVFFFAVCVKKCFE